MRNAAPKRLEKPLSLYKSNADRAKILRFDRRAGVVVLDQTPKTEAVIRLVRNLLMLLTRKTPEARSVKRTAARSRTRG
jgi:hypothetical protein